MIVLDDGWFSKRNDDTSSLGDWVIDIEKFPQGLKALVDDVNRVGCKFGIWWEPEMVSEQSVSLLFIVNYSQFNFNNFLIGTLHCSSRLVFPCSRQTTTTGKKSNGS
jgi:hypothetical protein